MASSCAQDSLLFMIVAILVLGTQYESDACAKCSVWCIRVYPRKRTIRVSLSIIKRYWFITENQIMQLLRLRNPRLAVSKLDTRERKCVALVLVQKCESRVSWWWKCQSASWQAREPRRADVSVQDWRPDKTNVPAQVGIFLVLVFFSLQVGGIPFFLREGQLFVLFRPSAD